MKRVVHFLSLALAMLLVVGAADAAKKKAKPKKKAAVALPKVATKETTVAIEKLMGLVLTAIAVEMILAGLKRYFFEP